MEVSHMKRKKWIPYILMFFLTMLLLPAGRVQAADPVTINLTDSTTHGGSTYSYGHYNESAPWQLTLSSGDFILNIGSDYTKSLIINVGSGATVVGGTISSGNISMAVNGSVTGGNFTCSIVYARNTISGGTFNCTVNNIGSITAGTFTSSASVTNDSIGTISGAEFSCPVTNNGSITGGTFNSPVTNNNSISGGTFNTDASVTNSSGATISGADFNSTVTNNGTIESGTFNNPVSNNSSISGGTFNNTITSSETASVTGSTSYSVAKTLTNLTASGSGDTMMNDSDYTMTLAPDAGYGLPDSVAVTLNGNTAVSGTDYTYDANTGLLTVKPAITAANKGPVTISAAGIKVYTVSVTGGTGSGNYAAGSSVTLTASVPDGQEFTGWTISEGTVYTSGSKSTASVTFTMPASDVTAAAAFRTVSRTDSETAVSQTAAKTSASRTAVSQTSRAASAATSDGTDLSLWFLIAAASLCAASSVIFSRLRSHRRVL